MNNKECKITIQDENGKWVPAEPIPYYPPKKKRSFKEIVVSTIKILKGKDGGQDDGMDIGV